MRLYRIEIVVEALVLADTADEACDCASEVVRDIYAPAHTTADEWDCVVYPDRWNARCLVYGEQGDVTVAEAIRMTRPS